MLTGIDHIVQARLLVTDTEQEDRELAATLRYQHDDPLAVRITFPPAVSLDGTEVTWAFGRSLLAAALRGPAGHGDVHIWPCGPDRTMLELRALEGTAMVEIATADLRCFLSRAYEAVPAGEEQRHLDIDAL